MTIEPASATTHAFVKMSHASDCWMMGAGMGDVVNLKRFKKRAERAAVGETGRRQPDAVRPNQIRTRSGRTAQEPRQRPARPAPDRRRGRVMKSPVVKRSIVVAGHKTSVSLEEAFWNGMKEISGLARHDAVRTGGRDRQQSPARQSVVRDSPLRARLFSNPCGVRRAGCKTAGIVIRDRPVGRGGVCLQSPCLQSL